MDVESGLYTRPGLARPFDRYIFKGMQVHRDESVGVYI